MNARRSVLAALVAGVALVSVGCNSAQKTQDSGAMAVKADNATCPISGKPVSSGVATTTYHGKHVGFCCPGCPGQFAKMTDAQKDEALSTKGGMK